jgi:hypothetical protein
MTHREALDFIRTYFDELFNKHNIKALDVYLADGYFDDDIGDPNLDHVKSSKEYLTELFARNPGTGVDVRDASTHDNVISAFLEWFVRENDSKKVIRKGIAIFVLEKQKILKRHTFVYYEA